MNILNSPKSCMSVARISGNEDMPAFFWGDWEAVFFL
jgi:hypothetical protein